MPDGRYVVGNVVRTRLEGHQVRSLVRSTTQTDGPGVTISLPQDGGQAGKVQASDYVLLLSGFMVHVERETGEKPVRAEPFSAQCEAGNVDLVKGDWNEPYLDELCLFPGGSHDDQVDASSGAFGVLSQTPPPMNINRYLRRPLEC
jgi:predicted phage terminase large subunit-like protein